MKINLNNILIFKLQYPHLTKASKKTQLWAKKQLKLDLYILKIKLK